MLHHIVTGVLIAGLNGIGLWHSIPLTDFNPTSGLLWRAFSSVEIASSLYGLRQIYPHVFLEDDLAMKKDLLLQHSIHTEEYETARTALEKSSSSLSIVTNIPQVTMSSLESSATRITEPDVLNDDSPKAHFDEELWHHLMSRNQINTRFWGCLIIALVVMQTYGLAMVHEIKSRKSFSEYCGEAPMDFVELVGQIQDFRTDMGYMIRTISGLGETIQGLGVVWENARIRIEKLFNQTMDQMDQMSQRNTDTITSIEAQLGELRKKTRDLWNRFQPLLQADIPKQLAKLNNMLNKDISDGLDARRLSRGDMESYSAGPAPNSASYDAPLSPGILSSGKSMTPRATTPTTPRATTPTAPTATIERPAIALRDPPAPKAPSKIPGKPLTKLPAKTPPKPPAKTSARIPAKIPVKAPTPEPKATPAPQELEEPPREPMTWHSARVPPTF